MAGSTAPASAAAPVTWSLRPLPGYSVSFLPSGSKPYQQHVTKPMFALPSYLKTEGYQTAAVHCFWAKYWSRDTAYPNLGLDDFISLEKMHGVQKVRRHYWTTGLVTDDSMADQIIGQYETMKASSDPIFLHAVTMQNHTNYNKDNYPDDERVKVPTRRASSPAPWARWKILLPASGMPMP